MSDLKVATDLAPIDNYGQQYLHFQLIGLKVITINGKSAYPLKCTYRYVTWKMLGDGYLIYDR
jgi:hypothetical protein